jgi:hypothetical protein
MPETEKPLFWIGSSYKDLIALPPKLKEDLDMLFLLPSRVFAILQRKFCKDLVGLV